MEWFCTYDYPGNVRELENLLMRALVLSTPPEILPGAWIPSGRSFIPTGPVTRLYDLERDVIVKRITRRDGNLDTVAKELGISRTTLWRRLREYQTVHD